MRGACNGGTGSSAQVDGLHVTYAIESDCRGLAVWERRRSCEVHPSPTEGAPPHTGDHCLRRTPRRFAHRHAIGVVGQRLKLRRPGSDRRVPWHQEVLMPARKIVWFPSTSPSPKSLSS